MTKKPKDDAGEPNGFELMEIKVSQIAARLGIDRDELVRQGREQLKIAQELYRKRLGRDK